MLACHPVRIWRWFSKFSNRVWRCEKAQRTLIDIWWQCPPPFCNWVCEFIVHLEEICFKFTLARCLLHTSLYYLRKYKHSLTKHLLNVLKSFITLHWKSTTVPFMKEWLSRVDTFLWHRGNLSYHQLSWYHYHKT